MPGPGQGQQGGLPQHQGAGQPQGGPLLPGPGQEVAVQRVGLVAQGEQGPLLQGGRDGKQVGGQAQGGPPGLGVVLEVGEHPLIFPIELRGQGQQEDQLLQIPRPQAAEEDGQGLLRAGGLGLEGAQVGQKALVGFRRGLAGESQGHLGLRHHHPPALKGLRALGLLHRQPGGAQAVQPGQVCLRQGRQAGAARLLHGCSLPSRVLFPLF